MSVSAVPATSSVVSQPGWLLSPRFDLNLIVTVAGVGLLSGAVALLYPQFFGVILILDLWFLGYHHVVSTFTRLCFDRESFQQHRFLVIQLPLIVLAVTVAAIALAGVWVLPTVYLYWQWFHYTRQSYGIERMYRRKAPEGTRVHDYITTRTLYAVPLFGILYRSWQRPETFLGMDVWYIPTSDIVLYLVGGVAASRCSPGSARPCLPLSGVSSPSHTPCTWSRTMSSFSPVTCSSTTSRRAGWC
ncbi:MAG: hypothetical protein R3B90_18705 [Planctomycetaceae bacterium]